MLYRVCSSLALIFAKIFLRIEIRGAENIPKRGGFILASNHASYLDPIVLGAICPRRLNFMARHDLFRNPIFSWLITSVGSFPVKRDSADLSAIKEAISRLKKGGALLLFPEGRRQESHAQDTKPQSGVGFLACKANVPVIPVFVKGTERAWPKGAKFIRPVKVRVFFGRQIDVKKSLNYQDTSLEIMKKIRYLAS